MLTHFEHVGIVKTFQGEIADTLRAQKEHEANAKLEDQHKDYRAAQAQLAREMDARIRALRWGLDQVQKIKHEYA